MESPLPEERTVAALLDSYSAAKLAANQRKAGSRVAEIARDNSCALQEIDRRRVEAEQSVKCLRGSDFQVAHLKRHLGNLPITAINNGVVRKYEKDRRAERRHIAEDAMRNDKTVTGGGILADATIGRNLVVLRAAINWAQFLVTIKCDKGFRGDSVAFLFWAKCDSAGARGGFRLTLTEPFQYVAQTKGMGSTVKATHQPATKLGFARHASMDPEKLATTFRRSPKGVVVTGVGGQILATNPAFCRTLNYNDFELRGSLGETIIPPEDRKIRAAERARLLAEGAGCAPVPVRYLHRDGHVVTVIESRTPLYNDEGSALGIFALIDAMPDDVAARAALVPVYRSAAPPPPRDYTAGETKGVRSGTTDDERFFGRIFEVSGEAYFVVDAETGIVVNCNQQAGELVQRPIDEIIGAPQALLHPNDERDHYWELFCHRAHQVGRQTSEVLVRRSDGSTVPVEITSTTMAWNGRMLVISIFKDITERRRTEAALLAFANRMHAILSSMFDAVITADEQGIIETFNDAAERLFGWRAYEVIGRSLAVLMPTPMHDQHDVFMTNYRRGGQAWNIGKERELVAQRKDGSLVPIELAITEIIDQGDYFNTSGGGNGRRSFVGVIRDITERKSAESALLTAKSQAELANRAKSEFLAHMSHELRTPLNAIIGLSESLKRDLFGPLAPRYVEYAETIFESGQHLLGIINDLLDMARIEAGRFELIEESIDVAAVIESCLTMVRARADHGGLTVGSRASPRAPRICADRRSVMQVLLNLLSNSVKFTPRGGCVTVTAGVGDSGQMVITVVDTGPGIAAEMLPRIFEPFQQADSRLSRKIEGTGLGLAISRNLMELHGGSLGIESEAGQGTIAHMRFPASRLITQPAS